MKKLASVFLISVFIIQLISFVLAQNTIPTPQRDRQLEQQQQQFAAERANKMFLWNTSMLIIAAISLILGFFISRKMIRTNPKKVNWTIHTLIGLASLVVFLATSIDGIRCLNGVYCGLTPVNYFIFFASLFPTIFSIFAITSLAKKRKGNRYSLNMSSSTIFIWLIFIILTPIVEFIVRPNFDIPAFIIMPITSGVIAFMLYFILGLIGYFIDKSKR